MQEKQLHGLMPDQPNQLLALNVSSIGKFSLKFKIFNFCVVYFRHYDYMTVCHWCPFSENIYKMCVLHCLLVLVHDSLSVIIRIGQNGMKKE